MGCVLCGVCGINLCDGDCVVLMEFLECGGDFFSFIEKGYGKCMVIEEYCCQGCGGMGIINFKVSDKIGEVIVVKEVIEDGIVIIMQEGKIICIELIFVLWIGCLIQGVKIMDFDGDDCIVVVVCIFEWDDDEESDDEDVVVIEELGDDLEEQFYSGKVVLIGSKMGLFGRFDVCF